MISIRNVCLTYGDRLLFNNLTCSIGAEDRIGLFGMNGAGKSTLLKVLAGMQRIDSGSISVTKGFTIAYMPQEVTLQSEKTILEETLSACAELIQLEQKKAALEAEMLAGKSTGDTATEYTAICDALRLQSVEEKRVRCERILSGLGFSHDQMSKPVSTLSVGWKMRIVLAKLLLQDADFYLFDEPTNHLDIVAKEWFLQFLREGSFGFLLVCHERHFLNVLCTKILELEFGNGTLYNGNYDQYIEQKESRLETLRSSYEAQQREIKEKEKTIARFRAKASKAGMARSMARQLEKVERIELPPSGKRVEFSFPKPSKSGRIVLRVKGVGYEFSGKKIFQNCSFTLERGDRMAIVAPNGTGKTTLINIISGSLKKQTGSIEFGENVSASVYDQDQLQKLDLQATVFENACAVDTVMTKERIRSVLGAFLFSADDIYKKAQVLSGGERSRLGMIRVLLQNANLLLLDEPTNHLDIPSKERLLDALLHYEGTILFVSHDHDFINRLATHILELRPNESIVYPGNYETYLFQKKEIEVRENKSIKETNSEFFNSVSHQKKQSIIHEPKNEETLRTLEKKIERLEKQIEATMQKFETLSYGTKECEEATKIIQKYQQELKTCTREWEQLYREK